MSFAKMAILPMGMAAVHSAKWNQVTLARTASTLTQSKHVKHHFCFLHKGSPICGDSIVILPETCDNPADPDCINCRKKSEIPICGNAVKDPSEECDDGNLIDGDGCS